MRHHGAIWDLIYFFWVGYMGETRRFPSYDCPAIIRHDHLLQCYHKLIKNVKEMAEFRHSYLSRPRSLPIMRCATFMIFEQRR